MIIINPNNFSEVSSSLSGSFSGSMHGKIVSFVNENSLTGSFSGSFKGIGSGSFRERFEGDARDVNSIFHFISSSAGEVSGGYESAIKFMSLADVNDVYRGLEISAENPSGVAISQNLLSSWGFSPDYGPGSSATKVHFRINNITSNNNLAHAYQTFPPYAVGSGNTHGLLNTTISGILLGQNLNALTSSGAIGLIDFNTQNPIHVYSGSLRSEITLNTLNINTLVSGLDPDLSGHELLILEDSSNALKNISADNAAVTVLGNSFDTNVFNVVTPDEGKLNLSETIVDRFTQLLGTGGSLNIGVPNNIAAISQSSSQIKFAVNDSDVLVLDPLLGPAGKIQPGTGNDLVIDGNDTATGFFGTSVQPEVVFESQEITSSAIQGNWHGTPAANNIPFDSSDIDKLKHIPMCINGEINGTVYNGDWVSFGNGAGTTHEFITGNDPTNQKSNLGVAMPLAGRIVRVVYDYNLADTDRQFTMVQLTINGVPVASPASGIIALNPDSIFTEHSEGQQTFNRDLQSGTAQTGIPFSAGDLLGFRFINAATSELGGTYIDDQLALWDNYDEATDTDPNSAISNVNFSCYFVFE